MLEFLNANAGAVTGVSTVALLLVTAAYAWITYQLLSETRQSRLSANQPRVVAYLRLNEVHGTIVQLHIANLSGAAATGVSAKIDRLTEWPEKFDLQESKILRDLSFMRPHELVKLDLGIGSSLFRDKVPAEFSIKIRFSSTDNRDFSFESRLLVESVSGRGQWKVFGTDDVARRLKEIVDVLKGFSGGSRIQADVYNSTDRDSERQEWEECIEEQRPSHGE